MDYILGLLTAVVFFVAILFAYYLGARTKQSKPIPVDEEKKQEIEQFNKNFKAMFNYDVDTAVQRKKVT
jgi:hypothetical protein